MQTVIILGAGSSADFGLPLGAQLYDEVQAIAEEVLSTWNIVSVESMFAEFNRIAGRFDPTTPHFELIQKIASEDPQAPVDFLRSFLDRLRIETAVSIDTFGLENSRYQQLCKALVGSIICQSISTQISVDENMTESWTFKQRKIPSPEDPTILIDNWIHQYAAHMRHVISRHKEHTYRFISFNYDQIVEKVLRAVWRPNEERQIGPLDDYVDFAYPHGKIIWNNDGTRMGRSSIGSVDSQIEFAHEHQANEDSKIIPDWVTSADRIITLGFNFGEDNVRKLGLDQQLPSTVMLYHNYNNDNGLESKIKELPIPVKTPFTGAIPQSILSGLIGEMPT